MIARNLIYHLFDRCKRTHGDQKLKGADVVAKGYPFKKDRDVSVQNFPVVLDPQGGPYVIIPMTYDPGADLKFYCTVRANKHIKLEEYSVPTQVCPSELLACMCPLAPVKQVVN